ncbi:MAG: TonB-dependent receptor [Emcibacter sp.]|nr:TonB-dependent receptor [Emcibacter sp.]
MKYQKHLITALLSSAAILPAAQAEDSMQEVVVSATRYERPLSQIGSSVSVITADDLEKSQTVFVQDILQNVPGLSLNQNGSFGGVSSLRIRGAATAQTVVLIDGVQINDVSAPGGGFNFANLDPGGIERIEVLRGPQSIMYGSDAIGGVVNIITPTGEEGLGGSLFAETGSYKTFRAGGHIAGGNDKLNFSLSGSGITTDGISKADENNGNSEADGYRNISLHGKVTGKLSENHSLAIISRYVDSRSEVDGFGPVDGDNVDFSKEFLIAGRGFFNYLDGALQNTLSVEYSKIDRRSEAGGAPNPFGDFGGERFNLDYFGHYTVNDDFGISFGLQHEETKAESTSPKKFNIDSVFSEFSWQGVEGLTLTAGLRYDDHNQYGGTTTPRLTAAYYFADSGTKIFANWGEGFKAPSIFQLTYICGFCGLTAPNADLKPEESNGWEVGIEQALWEDRIQLGATYFDQKIKNLIDFDFSVGFGNINNVRTKGIELSLEAQLVDGLIVRGNYTYTDAKDKGSNIILVRVPKNAAFAEVQWQVVPEFNVAFSMTYNGKETDRFSPGTDGWTRFDLKASYEFSDGIEVYGRVDNLFNKEYQQVFGFGTPDRSFFAGVRSKF